MTRSRPPHCRQVSSGTSLCPTASRRPSAVQIGDPADLSMSMANTAGRSEAAAIDRHQGMCWAQRLKRVFAIDIQICRRCGGRLRVIEISASGNFVTYLPGYGAFAVAPW